MDSSEKKLSAHYILKSKIKVAKAGKKKSSGDMDFNKSNNIKITSQHMQESNNELDGANKDLMWLNQELARSREEVLLMNKELTRINREYYDREGKINEARLYNEAIINTINEPLMVLDRTLKIRSVNNSFHHKFNTANRSIENQFIYKIIGGIFSKLSPDTATGKILISGEELTDCEITIVTQPYGERVLLLNAKQVINEKSNDKLTLLSITDITDKKIAERQMKIFSEGLEAKIRERTALLEQSNLQLEQFAHTASHELQEPLRKIRTFAKVLKQSFDENNTDELRTYINKIDEASVRMTHLVQNLLDLASISQNLNSFDKINLNDIVKNVLNDFELSLKERIAKVNVDQLPEIDAVPFQMNQLFYDIISNSIKFSKPDEPLLINVYSRKLKAKELELFPLLNKAVTHYKITIEDNGIGFDQKYAQRIFIMFQRLHSGKTYPGTGIGLATCKKIVQNYHGEIYAEGVENIGAKFHVILPVVQPNV